MSSEDFDDSDFDLTPEELHEMDSAIAGVLSSEAAILSNTLVASNALSHAIVPHAIGTSSSTGAGNRGITELDSPVSSESSFADEAFRDPNFLNALDESLSQMERQYQHLPPADATTLPNSPHAANLLRADGDGLSLTFDVIRRAETQGDHTAGTAGSLAVSLDQQNPQRQSARVSMEEDSGSSSPKWKSRPYATAQAAKYMKHASSSGKSQHGSSAQSSPSVKLRSEAESDTPKTSVSQQKVDAMLEGYEELLTCSVCSEYYVYPCSVIPCGHTFCAPCISEWLTTPLQRRRPSCPTCRSSCQSTMPSFIVGDFVEKHVDALASNGVEGWTSTQTKDRGVLRPGAFREDWERRRREWKSIESRRKSSAPTPQNRPGSTSFPGPPSRVIQVFIDVDDEYEGEEDDLFSSDDDDDDDDGSEDAGNEGEVLDAS